REAVLNAMPAHMLPAIGLIMFTGLGPKDALRLPRTFYKAGEIATRRSKTGEPVFWPAPRAPREILDAGPTHSAVTLCANSNGRPWTDDGFRASWRKNAALGRTRGPWTLGSASAVMTSVTRSDRDPRRETSSCRYRYQSRRFQH